MTVASTQWASPEVVPTELGGGRSLPDACASPEVDSLSTNALEDLEQIDKSPSKCRQNRDPKTRGQPDPEARHRDAVNVNMIHVTAYDIRQLSARQLIVNLGVVNANMISRHAYLGD
jgi:hypothetical protein